ncbi:MAG: histidine triad nucleotide-binding protein [bacterium]|nr:histidine triad nucleotide-binding protein [bacterium]
MAGSCLFCRIVAGELSSRRVYEDDRVVAFEDIQPVAPVHVLLVPRRHLASLADLTPEDGDLAGHLLLVAARLGGELCPDGYRLLVNTGEEAGQTVGHLHLHVLGGRRLGALG